MVIDRKSIVISLLNKMARIKINAKFWFMDLTLTFN
jgi:hypothetical protein